jgi:N-acetylglutamate synthase-like GNAT family acetyltransferase
MLDQAGLRVRPATESDLGKILELYAQAEFDAGKVLPLATAKQLFERFADYPDYTLYVAEHGGDIVGTFALLVMHNLGHLGAPSAIVEDVAVRPRRKGTASAKP